MRKSLPKRAVLPSPANESLGSAQEREYLRCARSYPIGVDIRAEAGALRRMSVDLQPSEEMKIAVVITSAKAGIHIRPEGTGFPFSRE